MFKHLFKTPFTDKPRSQLLGIRKLGDEAGQTMTEYIILVIVVGLVCIPMFKALPKAVQGYLRPFYYSVSRPVP